LKYRHLCLFLGVLLVVEALRRADPPSKEN
jgi:hypothetical protein